MTVGETTSGTGAVAIAVVAGNAQASASIARAAAPMIVVLRLGIVATVPSLRSSPQSLAAQEGRPGGRAVHDPDRAAAVARSTRRRLALLRSRPSSLNPHLIEQ